MKDLQDLKDFDNASQNISPKVNWLLGRKLPGPRAGISLEILAATAVDFG